MTEARGDAVGAPRRLVRAYLHRRYTILFYSLLVTLGAYPLLAALGLDADILPLLLGVNLVAAVLGAGGRSRWRPLQLLFAAVVGMRLLAAWLHAPSVVAATLPLWTTIALLAAASALRFALGARAVDAEHVYAALSAYLLAGLFWGVLYRVVENTWAGSFALAGERPGGGFPLSSALYFSFVTLATLGYGDIVPRSDVARGLAIVEAVAGQLYLAVMIARLVSLYVRGAAANRP